MISVIITSYKEEKTIGKSIESILNNNLKEKYEILVLAPDESTLNVAKKYKHVQVIKDKGEGKPAALNLAFKKAKGNILILTDGDVYISDNSLKNLLEPFNNKKIGAVTGRPVSIDSKKTKFGFFGHLLSDIAHHRREIASKTKKRFYCSGYLFAIRAGIITKVPEDALSEDGIISHKVYSKGFEIAYSPNSEVYIKYPTNFKDWINQKQRSAGGYNQIKKYSGIEIRSFSKESAGIFQVLKYPKTIKEFFWTIQLIFMRLYLWFVIFKNINLKNKESKKIWVRVESTK